MNQLQLATITLGLCGVIAQASADDQNWPQWRGPEGSGKTPASHIISEWGPEQNVKWRIGLPEPGNSTPIVWGDRVFLSQPLRSANQRALFCLDRKTGREQWRRAVTYDQPEPSHKTNPYCSASPVTDGQRVVAWFGSAGLCCWDLNGNQLWRRDLGPQEHMWGYGASPILYNGLCILKFGPGNQEFLIAVDVNTGETRWKVDALDDDAERALSGPENDGNANEYSSDKPRGERIRGGWSTPILIDVDGKKELVAAMPRRVSGFDPMTGKLLWTCGGAAPLAYASLMEWDGMIVALGGYNGACLAVRAGGRGDVTRTHRIWHTPKGGSWLGTGVISDGAVYICNMRGILHCLDVESGRELWKHRAGGGDSWSSITQSGDGRMFLLAKSGTTTVFRPDRGEFRQLAENNIKETTNASVVIAGSDLLIRTDNALWSFGQTKQASLETSRSE